MKHNMLMLITKKFCNEITKSRSTMIRLWNDYDFTKLFVTKK